MQQILYVLTVSRLGGGKRSFQCYGPTVVKATPNRDEAQAECDRLNEAEGGGYTVDEVEVPAESFPRCRARYRASKGKMLRVARAAFFASCRDLFDAHPGLQSFGWRQYHQTSFCANPLCHSGSTFFVDGHDPDINGFDGRTRASERSPEAELQRPVSQLLEAFEDELANLFGDDVAVTVLRDGTVEVEDYYEE